jgi:hypothetical protein
MAKKTTKTATAKATKTAKSAKAAPAALVKKDGKGRFWLVPKDGGAEQGPFDTKAQALSAKNGQPAAETKPAKTKKAKAAKEPKAKKVGALDAAAQVLAASGEPMNCKQLIEAMASKGLWSSPGGKTPHATLYAAILREITVKGKEARFKKTDRGHFTLAK